jgi:RNA polymerase sigma-70 factor (ECF subfamily)
MELVQARPVVIDVEAELVALYPQLARRLTLILRNEHDAEDIAQTAFEKAFNSRQHFAGRDVRAWFYTIGLRLAFNELRRRSRAAIVMPDFEPSWAITSDPDLWTALGQLEPQHRAALLLSELDGYTDAEIGRLLKAPAGTVSSWISRTKDRLRVVLGGEYD